MKGEIDPEKITLFAEEHAEIEKWQICPFLNLENSSSFLGNNSLADSTQDNGLCVQGEGFDYLLDMNNTCPVVSEGEVYVPACYRSMYDLSIGDNMQIGSEELVIAFLACVLVQAVILLFIRHRLKKLEKMTALEALFSVKTPDKKAGNRQYVVIILFMRLLVEMKRYQISLQKALGAGAVDPVYFDDDSSRSHLAGDRRSAEDKSI